MPEGIDDQFLIGYCGVSTIFFKSNPIGNLHLVQLIFYYFFYYIIYIK